MIALRCGCEPPALGAGTVGRVSLLAEARAAGRHLEFLTLTGNRDQAIALLESHLPISLDTPSLQNQMHFHGAV